jgi:hypothetical protein
MTATDHAGLDDSFPIPLPNNVFRLDLDNNYCIGYGVFIMQGS